MSRRKSKEGADLVIFMYSFIFEICYLIFAYFKSISKE